MLFARMLAAFRLRDDPGYIVRDGKHLQLGAMPIGLAANSSTTCTRRYRREESEGRTD